MKKLLLSLFALFSVASVFADEVTFDFAGQGYENAQDFDGQTVDLGAGVSVTFSKGTGSTTPKYYNTGTAMRLYGSNSATFTSDNTITSIVLTFSASGNVGTIAADCGSYEVENVTGTWTGSSSTVVLTNTATSGHARIQTATITFEKAGSSVATPKFDIQSGTFYEPQTVSLSAADGATIKYSVNGGEEQTYSQPFTLSEAGTYEIVAYAQVGSEKSSEVSRTITIATIPVYTSIADLRTNCTATKQADAPMVKYEFTDLLVTGAKNSNVFVSDGKLSYLIYGSNAKGLAKGDRISGSIQGQLYMYNQLGELAVSDSYAGVTVVSQGNAVEPVVAGITDVIENYSQYEGTYVIFKDVTFSADKVASKAISIENEDGDNITLYDNYSTFTNYVFDTTKKYNVAAYVTRRNEAVQCYLMDESDVKIITDLLTPESSWSLAAESVLVGETAKAAFTTNSDGAVTYTSSNEAVATVSADGTITAVSAGSCVITATTAETSAYLASTEVLTLTVTEALGGLDSFVNGGFEDWASEEQPIAWKSSTTASNATLAQSTDARSGQYSCCVKNATANKRLASKEFLLPAGWYVMSFYAKSASDTLVAQARPGYAPWDAEKAALGSYVYGNYTEDLTSSEWTLVSYMFELKAETQLNLVVMNPKSTASKTLADLLVDDFVLRAATEEETSVKTLAGAVSSQTAIYNLAGQRVVNPSKGFYIVNGKVKYVK